MNLVLATESLASSGGSETYLVTLAQELDRLGHELTIVTREPGALSASLGERGFALAIGEDGLPPHCDAALALDGPAALDARARWPETIVVQCAMSEVYDVQMPPRAAGVVDAVVVMSDRVAARVRATADAPRCVRMRQPIDTRRFAPAGALPQTPRRALVLSNYVDPRRLAMVREAFAAAGVACEGLGAQVGGIDDRPESVLRDVDIVVGKGRAALEGMSCGRAVYLLDYAGRDGWVTADAYAEQEADAFAGQATSLRFDPRGIAADLAAYDPLMGEVNRDLVLAHHSARVHAMDVVALLRALGAPDRPCPDGAGLHELARVSRAQWRAEREAMALLAELARRDQALGHLEWEAERQTAAARAAEERGAALAHDVERQATRAHAAQQRAVELEGALRDLRATAPRRGLRLAAAALDRYDRVRGR